MINIIDCMRCKYLKGASINIENKPRKREITRDCIKNIKGNLYIAIELNSELKNEKANCKYFELGDKTMLDELEKFFSLNRNGHERQRT